MLNWFPLPTPRAWPPRGLPAALCLGAVVLVLAGPGRVVDAEPRAGGDEEREGETVAVSSAASADSGIEVVTWGNAAAVLLLVGAGGYALHVHRRTSGGDSHAAIRPVEQHSLGPSKQLRLVTCGDEVLLLGVTDEGLTLLKTYPHEAFEEHPALQEEAAGTAPVGASGAVPSSATFSEVLSRFARHNRSA